MRFLKLNELFSCFWKTFTAPVTFFPDTSVSKIFGSLALVLRALRHLQVHVYNWISV